MKKIFTFCLAIIILFLTSGCKKSSDVTAVTTGLSFTAQINFRDQEIICDAIIDKNGETTLTVVSPEKIKGLQYKYSDSEGSMGYSGLEHKTSSDLQENVFCYIYKIFRSADKIKENVYIEKNIFFLKGENDIGSYKIHFGQSGLPIYVECKNISLYINIKNSKII